MPRAQLPLENGEIDDLVMRLLELKGGSPNADLLKDAFETVLGLIDDATNRGELKIVARSLQEMRDSFRVFAPHAGRRKVCVFGSARTAPDKPEYAMAHQVGRLLAERGLMVITGAGGGIMRAANEGAGRDASFGLHIRLPFEAVDETLFEDARLVNYRYFFTRKLSFVKECDGLILFPGGFGTLDECFEVLTLIQTGKSELLPVVFLDVPGGGYWASFERHVAEQLIPRGLIGPEDRSLWSAAEDPEHAVRGITDFYRNYHSMRYVRDVTVLRHTRPADAELVTALNREFADILTHGRIEAAAALPEEANEPEIAGLPRLVLPFDRRSYGRLRLLVDRLNAAAPATAGAAAVARAASA